MGKMSRSAVGELFSFLKCVLLYGVLLRFESISLQKRMGSNVQAKSRTFWPSVKLGEEWAKYLRWVNFTSSA